MIPRQLKRKDAKMAEAKSIGANHAKAAESNEIKAAELNEPKEPEAHESIAVESNGNDAVESEKRKRRQRRRLTQFKTSGKPSPMYIVDGIFFD
jgi:hypothetical protein